MARSGRVGRNFRALTPDALVKKAMPPVVQRGRPALRAVHLYMLTSWNIFQTPYCFLASLDFGLAGTKFVGYPPLPLDLWNHEVSRKFPAKSVLSKKLDIKIRETKDLEETI